MPAWLLWVIVAAVLGGVEMLSLTLVAGLLAVATPSTNSRRATGQMQSRTPAQLSRTSSASSLVLITAL
jgi:hypothetical protein